MVLIAIHLFLATLLFRFVNWIGEHATDFGYGSTTLFEDPIDSLAFNIFIRSLTPAIFIVATSAFIVAFGYPELRYGIYWISIYYFMIRALYVLIMNMHGLVSWPRYAFHAGVGLAATWLAYHFLVIPNRSLLPDMNTAGNELWLAIVAFLYAATNKIKSSSAPGTKRRNEFVRRGYEALSRKYGNIIDSRIMDEKLKLIIYSVIIYENYCRPPVVRLFEKFIFWKKFTSTGIMQFRSERKLSDEESVKLGIDKISQSWNLFLSDRPFEQTRSTIADYNRDSNYVDRVTDVMYILSRRVLPGFSQLYDEMMSWETSRTRVFRFSATAPRISRHRRTPQHS